MIKTYLTKATKYQIALIVISWVALLIYIQFCHDIWDPTVSFTSFVGVPATIIIIFQLVINSHISQASYIKDYALRFRADSELTESFHYLIYKYGNELLKIYLKPEEERTEEEKKALEESQQGVPNFLQFFNPESAIGIPQERKLDNVLGFFDTVGYDLTRGMVSINDVSGVFSFHLDHLIQRNVVKLYLCKIKNEWDSKKSFHTNYKSPTPFGYLRSMLSVYVKYRGSNPTCYQK